MVIGPKSSLTILKEELNRRFEKNSRYSVRAFARDLGIESSTLSRILNGKRKFSTELARIAAEKLYSSSREQDYFVALVESESARRPKARQAAKKKVDELGSVETRQLQKEVDSGLSEWYHPAILDYSALEDADMCPEEVSRRLGISKTIAKQAISELVQHGLLTEIDGRVVKSADHVVATLSLPPEKRRRIHLKMIDKARDCLEDQEEGRRVIRSMTMSLNDEDLGRLRILIEDFFGEAKKAVSHDRASNKLYQLNIQLFDLLN